MAMSPERFEFLAGAYGGDIRRWPSDEQAPGYAYLEANAEAADQLLEAAELDAALNASAPLSANDLLNQRLINSAPSPRPIWRSTGAWFSGAMMAAACAAGVMVGVNYSGLIFADPASEVLAETGSAFDGGAWFDGLEAEG